ncbi:hypothetical protein [Kribbella sp. NBC_00359]
MNPTHITLSSAVAAERVAAVRWIADSHRWLDWHLQAAAISGRRRRQ